jgi:hypothetical protein
MQLRSCHSSVCTPLPPLFHPIVLDNFLLRTLHPFSTQQFSTTLYCVCCTPMFDLTLSCAGDIHVWSGFVLCELHMCSTQLLTSFSCARCTLIRPNFLQCVLHPCSTQVLTAFSSARCTLVWPNFRWLFPMHFVPGATNPCLEGNLRMNVAEQNDSILTPHATFLHNQMFPLLCLLIVLSSLVSLSRSSVAASSNLPP